MFSFLSSLEIAEMYTVYCMDCEEKGIEPKSEKEWYNELFGISCD